MPEIAKSQVGWATVAFGDVVRQVKDKVDPEQSGLQRYIAGEHMDTDDLRIRRWGDIGDGYLGPAFHMRFKPGQVLYGSRRTYLRKVALANFEGITANTTYVIESKDPAVLLPELVPFVMQTERFHSHSRRESKGSVNPYVNFSDLAWYEFALPPLVEQRRIAKVLLANEAALVSLDLLAAKLEQTRFAHLNHFFKPRFPDGLPLPEVASIASGGTPPKSKQEFWNGELPWASGKDLKVRSLETTELKLTNEGWSVAKTAPAGSTLIVVRGMILAHTFPVTVCAVPMAFNQDLRALVARDGLVPEYLTLWAEWAGPWFLTRTSESSHGTKRLDSEIFDDALVPRPAIEVQEDLVRAQDFFLNQKEQLEQRQSQARDCKSSLLHEILEVCP